MHSILHNPISQARRQVIAEANIRGLVARMGWLRESLKAPEQVAPGTIKHPQEYVDAVLAVAQVAEDAGTREFVKLFLERDPVYSNTDVGLAAIQFESYLIEKDRELFSRFVETQVENGQPDFLAIFEGKIAAGKLTQLMEELEGLVKLEVMLEAGQVATASHEMSDLTILKGIPEKGIRKRVEADKSQEQTALAPQSPADYKKVESEGGLSPEAFKVVFPDAVVGEQLTEYRDSQGVKWVGSSTRAWKPVEEMTTSANVGGFRKGFVGAVEGARFKMGDRVRVTGTKAEGEVTRVRRDEDGFSYQVAGRYWSEKALELAESVFEGALDGSFSQFIGAQVADMNPMNNRRFVVGAGAEFLLSVRADQLRATKEFLRKRGIKYVISNARKAWVGGPRVPCFCVQVRGLSAREVQELRAVLIAEIGDPTDAPRQDELAVSDEGASAARSERNEGEGDVERAVAIETTLRTVHETGNAAVIARGSQTETVGRVEAGVVLDVIEALDPADAMEFLLGDPGEVVRTSVALVAEALEEEPEQRTDEDFTSFKRRLKRRIKAAWGKMVGNRAGKAARRAISRLRNARHTLTRAVRQGYPVVYAESEVMAAVEAALREEDDALALSDPLEEGVSAATLTRIQGVTPEKAKQIKKLIDDASDAKGVEDAFEQIDTIMGGDGVETVQGGTGSVRYWMDTVLVYVNLGDTYDTTLCYETRKGNWFVGSWGDWVERYGEKYAVESTIEEARRRSKYKLPHWFTTEKGHKIYVEKAGQITKGNPYLLKALNPKVQAKLKPSDERGLAQWKADAQAARKAGNHKLHRQIMANIKARTQELTKGKVQRAQARSKRRNYHESEDGTLRSFYGTWCIKEDGINDALRIITSAGTYRVEDSMNSAHALFEKIANVYDTPEEFDTVAEQTLLEYAQANGVVESVVTEACEEGQTKTVYVVKGERGFYAEHSRQRTSPEYPDATLFTSPSAAKLTARKLTSGDSRWGDTAEVWQDYGLENERLVGVAERGYFTASESLEESVDARDLKTAVDGYIECALWSSTDGDDSLDANYDASDVDPQAKRAAERDVKDFLTANAELIAQAMEAKKGYDYSNVGHDFWLSRNGHGAGFFDHGNAPVWRQLQQKAKEYGGENPYVSDGKVHGLGESTESQHPFDESQDTPVNSELCETDGVEYLPSTPQEISAWRDYRDSVVERACNLRRQMGSNVPRFTRRRSTKVRESTVICAECGEENDSEEDDGRCNNCGAALRATESFDGSLVGRDPSTYTDAEREQAVRDLAAKFTTAQLRRKQSVVKAQIKVFYDRHDTERLTRQQALFDLYSDAVSLREFGESVDEGDYDPDKPRKLKSGMPSTCRVCRKPIRLGAKIVIDPKRAAGKKCAHQACVGENIEEGCYESVFEGDDVQPDPDAMARLAARLSLPKCESVADDSIISLNDDAEARQSLKNSIFGIKELQLMFEKDGTAGLRLGNVELGTIAYRKSDVMDRQYWSSNYEGQGDKVWSSSINPAGCVGQLVFAYSQRKKIRMDKILSKSSLHQLARLTRCQFGGGVGGNYDGLGINRRGDVYGESVEDAHAKLMALRESQKESFDGARITAANRNKLADAVDAFLSAQMSAQDYRIAASKRSAAITHNRVVRMSSQANKAAPKEVPDAPAVPLTVRVVDAEGDYIGTLRSGDELRDAENIPAGSVLKVVKRTYESSRSFDESVDESKELWQRTRGNYVFGAGVAETGATTERALRMRIKEWERRQAQVGDSGTARALADAKQELERAQEHEAAVKAAVAAGKPVEALVLYDYVDRAWGRAALEKFAKEGEIGAAEVIRRSRRPAQESADLADATLTLVEADAHRTARFTFEDGQVLDYDLGTAEDMTADEAVLVADWLKGGREELPTELGEKAPPGFSGTVKAMKDKHGFPAQKAFALAWSLYKKGAKPHYPPEKGKEDYVSPGRYAARKKLVKEAAEEIHTVLNSDTVRDIAEMIAVDEGGTPRPFDEDYTKLTSDQREYFDKGHGPRVFECGHQVNCRCAPAAHPTSGTMPVVRMHGQCETCRMRLDRDFSDYLETLDTARTSAMMTSESQDGDENVLSLLQYITTENAHLVTEASLSRILGHFEDDLGIVALSADRNDRAKNPQENAHLNRVYAEKLEQTLRSMRKGFNRVKGGYVYHKNGESATTFENSYIVFDVSKEEALKLAKIVTDPTTYRQESIMWGKKGEGAHLIYADGKMEKVGDEFVPAKVGDFFSQWRKRNFSFVSKEAAAKDAQERPANKLTPDQYRDKYGRCPDGWNYDAQKKACVRVRAESVETVVDDVPPSVLVYVPGGMLSGLAWEVELRKLLGRPPMCP
jgi:hypothetical protein